jgi:hypothetical protein
MSKSEIEVKFEERQSATPRPSTPLPSISQLIKSALTEPSGVPRSFFEQFVIYNGQLWFYDTSDAAWHSSGGIGTPAGDDGVLQYNNGGVLGGTEELISEGDASAIVYYGKALLDFLRNGVGQLFVGITTGFVFEGTFIGMYLDTGDHEPRSLSILNSGGDIEISAPSGDVLAFQNRGALLPDTADIGFLYIQCIDGTPTGTPGNANGFISPLVYDTVNNKLWAYNGSWRSASFS